MEHCFPRHICKPLKSENKVKMPIKKKKRDKCMLKTCINLALDSPTKPSEVRSQTPKF